MRTALSIGFIAFLTACAGASPRPQSEGAPYGYWQGFLERDGLREPVSVELTAGEPTAGRSAWDGQLSAGRSTIPLEGVRVSGNNVHFEVSGEGVFDGVVAGDSMAGSVSGPASGAFSLSRVDEADWTPYFLGP
jgi:hypothetical protein